MSVHNTEIHRCRECQEVVIVVPEGFTLAEGEADQKAEAHRKTCPVLLERMLNDE